MKLSDFLGRYQSDDNEWWRLEQGEAQNMFDAAVESIAVLGARAERAETERDAARAEVARLRDAIGRNALCASCSRDVSRLQDAVICDHCYVLLVA